MALVTIIMASCLLVIVTSPATAQTIASPFPAPAPAPAPAPSYVNLTKLLSDAGPFNTFLSYLVQTKVIDTFQNQVNNTEQGITIFVPTDSAFSSLKKPSLSNLTQDQLKSLLLYHAFPNYYPLSEFKNLSSKNPISTFAGGQYAVNVTDESGLVRVSSGWSNPKISSSVLSTDPIAIYAINHVLLPEAIFGTPPDPAPAPAPAPDVTTPSDVSPSGSASSPKSSESSTTDSSSYSISASVMHYFVLVVSSSLMLMW